VKHYRIEPGSVRSASLEVPGDKSISHRALMLGAIAEGQTDIDGLLIGADCLATLAALQSLGVSIDRPAPTSAVVHGVGLQGLGAAPGAIDMGNSGTAMRLFAGLLGAQTFDSTLIGDASLSQRPMNRVITPLESMGARIGSNGGLPPLVIRGNQPLKAIDYALPVASAQVKSALLLAGLYAEGETYLRSPAVTRDHTERMLRTMGVTLSSEDNHVRLSPGQRLSGRSIQVPGDLSSAAFFIVAALIAEDCELLIRRVGVNPTRIGVIEILRDMGASIAIENPALCGEEPVADLRVRSSSLRGIDVAPERVSLAIDEFPVLFVAAAAAEGTSRFSGLGELRVKESDRIAVAVNALRALGITATETPTGAKIIGGEFTGGLIDGQGDHRIAMAFAVAATRASRAVAIQNVAAVDTSFPGFHRQLAEIGGHIGLHAESAA